jgi:hypothetical protein
MKGAFGAKAAPFRRRAIGKHARAVFSPSQRRVWRIFGREHLV